MKQIAWILMSVSLLWAGVAAAAPAHPQLIYPSAARDTIVNDYFGTRVPAPYQ